MRPHLPRTLGRLHPHLRWQRTLMTQRRSSRIQPPHLQAPRQPRRTRPRQRQPLQEHLPHPRPHQAPARQPSPPPHPQAHRALAPEPSPYIRPKPRAGLAHVLAAGVGSWSSRTSRKSAAYCLPTIVQSSHTPAEISANAARCITGHHAPAVGMPAMFQSATVAGKSVQMLASAIKS